MLVWLDSNSNVKGKPNENYARELMELFTLGVGNYTENGRPRGRPRLHRLAHRRRAVHLRRPASTTTATKTVLGQTGHWDGGDVVRIVLEPAGRGAVPGPQALPLLRQRGGRPARRAAGAAGRALPRAATTTSATWSRTMLRSRHFYSEHAFRQRIKSPVEYVLGVVPSRATHGRAARSGRPARRRWARRCSPRRTSRAGRAASVAEHRDRAGAAQLRRAMLGGPAPLPKPAGCAPPYGDSHAVVVRKSTRPTARRLRQEQSVTDLADASSREKREDAGRGRRPARRSVPAGRRRRGRRGKQLTALRRATATRKGADRAAARPRGGPRHDDDAGVQAGVIL